MSPATQLESEKIVSTIFSNEPGECLLSLIDFSQTNTRRSLALLALGALLGLAIAGYGLFTAAGTATHTVPPEAIATVNGRLILRTDFVTQVQTQFGITFKESTREQRERVLDDMIDEELMVQRGLEADLASYDPEVRQALVNGVELQIFADVLAQQPTDEELKNYYETHKDRYVRDGIMMMRDLVVPVEKSRTPEQTERYNARERCGVFVNLDDHGAGFERDQGQLRSGEHGCRCADREHEVCRASGRLRVGGPRRRRVPLVARSRRGSTSASPVGRRRARRLRRVRHRALSLPEGILFTGRGRGDGQRAADRGERPRGLPRPARRR